MKIPNFLGEQQLVDKNGHLTEPWKKTLEQLFQELQTQMSDEGHIAPSQPTTNITKLNLPEGAGSLLYDEDTDKLKVNIAGTFKEVTTA